MAWVLFLFHITITYHGEIKIQGDDVEMEDILGDSKKLKRIRKFMIE